MLPQALCLPGTAQHAEEALPKGTDGVNAQYVFRTVRPADYSTPYDTMLKHGVNSLLWSANRICSSPSP